MESVKPDQSDLEDNREITKHIVGGKEVWAGITFQLKGTACAEGNMMQSENRCGWNAKSEGNMASLEREECGLFQKWERSQHVGAATATRI